MHHCIGEAKAVQNVHRALFCCASFNHFKARVNLRHKQVTMGSHIDHGNTSFKRATFGSVLGLGAEDALAAGADSVAAVVVDDTVDVVAVAVTGLTAS